MAAATAERNPPSCSRTSSRSGSVLGQSLGNMNVSELRAENRLIRRTLAYFLVVYEGFPDPRFEGMKEVSIEEIRKGLPNEHMFTALPRSLTDEEVSEIISLWRQRRDSRK